MTAMLLAVDAATASTALTGIARACYAIDDYYAPLRQAFLHGGKAREGAGPMDQLMNQTALAILNGSIGNWYGTRRAAITAAAIEPFAAPGAAAFADQLAALMAVDKAVRDAGGAADADQLAQARTQFAAASGWIDHATQQLNGSVAILDDIRGELKLLHDMSEGPYADDGSDVLELFHRSAGLEEAAQSAIGDLLIAWTVVADLAGSIAARLADAEARALGSILQLLDLGASLKEWARVRDLALALAPGPPRG